jgi:hypothetical protein
VKTFYLVNNKLSYVSLKDYIDFSVIKGFYAKEEGN